MSEPIYIERGHKWSFASAEEWPGWCRHARGAEDPVAELVAFGPRYATALGASGMAFEPSADLEVTEELTGNSGTEWGVPSVVPAADLRPLDERESARLAAILQAMWAAFDRAIVAAQGRELRKGPRGGGRDLRGIIDHCLGADQAYLSKLGSKRPKVAGNDLQEVMAAMRARAVEAFFDRAADRPLRDPSRARDRWTPRWYVRYAAWHTIHHAWEIEDRRLDEPAT